MDYMLSLWVRGLVEMSRASWMLGAGDTWKPGTPLKLLFAGYNGARNTGADVRVEEMLRQVRHVLGDDNLELSVLTQNTNLTSGYFDRARQIHLPDLFPNFLYREVPRHHGVVACEGSMFKSKFANALTLMMIASLGIAAARNRLSVGYGAEAGKMDRYVRRMCRRYCSQSMVITRNTESRDRLAKLGISADVGTDTAWTFQPHGPEYGQKALAGKGWDGRTPILVICPINPFWWPVRASLLKAAASVTGAFRSSKYRSVYFHNSGPEVDAAFNRYVGAITNAVKAFASRHNVFCILVAMERLDAPACHRVAEGLGGAPVFTSDEYDMYQLVSILRCARMMISSRYHGIVTCMPALVASAGITMDERIQNLMADRGHENLLMTVDQPELEQRLQEVLGYLHREADSIREGIARSVVRNLRSMARMGAYFEEHVQAKFPGFPFRDGVRHWAEYLPPLDANLQKLLESYGG